MGNKSKTKPFNKFTKIEQLKIIENEGGIKDLKRQRNFLLEDKLGGPDVNIKTLKIIEY